MTVVGNPAWVGHPEYWTIYLGGMGLGMLIMLTLVVVAFALFGRNR